MTHPDVPVTQPVRLARETWLIPDLAAADPGTYVPVNSMLIRGAEPIIVDTGAPIHREHWLDQVFSLVEPDDVRWLFLSHDDGDHTGALHDVLESCRNATVVINAFGTERLALERPLPLDRLRWIEPGGTFDAGDRRMRLVLPPIFDGPTTRGVIDESTGVLWAVDSFAALTTGAVHRREEVPDDLYDETFLLFNSLISPWHQWLDPVKYGGHVDSVAALRPRAVASAHGPILTGTQIDDAFERVRGLAGTPRLMLPEEPTLDEFVTAAISPDVPVPAVL